MDLLSTAGKIGVQGFMHPSELEKLAELATGKDVLEIGSFMGLSAWAMAIAARHVTCVDTFRAWTNGQTQADELTTLAAFLDATRRYRNITHHVMPSAEAARNCHVEGQFDLIFLDAMHTYSDVKADIFRWWPRVRGGGVMVFHDYGHGDYPGVKQAVDEAFDQPLDGTTEVTLRWVAK